MYTYLTSLAFFFLVSALIYRKNIRDFAPTVAFIMIIGSFISTAVVNGIFSSNIKYETHRTTVIYLINNNEFEFNDSVSIDTSYIGDRIKSDYISLGLHDVQYYEAEYQFMPGDTSMTCPQVWKYKDFPVSGSNWISTIGIPRKNRHFVYYLPNDSINHVIVDILNAKKTKHENKLAEVIR